MEQKTDIDKWLIGCLFGFLSLLFGCSSVSKNSEKESTHIQTEGSASESRVPVIISQADMNREACNANSNASEEMDRIYKNVLSDPMYAENKEFLSAFKKAQMAWVKFRDASVEARFPGKNKRLMYGSVYEMCSCEFARTLYQNRIAELKLWAEGSQDGNVCSGALKNH